jgi:hypothetical protein
VATFSTTAFKCSQSRLAVLKYFRSTLVPSKTSPVQESVWAMESMVSLLGHRELV